MPSITFASSQKVPCSVFPTGDQERFIAGASTKSVLLACPGSGKTKTAVSRFLERCKTAEHGIAYLSFTNVAIDEALKEARDSGAGLYVEHPHVVCTIDAFFRNYIFEPFIRFFVGPVPRTINIIEDVGVQRGMSTDKTLTVPGVLPKLEGVAKNGKPYEIQPRLAAWDIRVLLFGDKVVFDFEKDSYRHVWETIGEEHYATIRKAKLECLKRGYATYQDIVWYSLAILRKQDGRAAKIIAERFKEIIIDEAQDTSGLQQAAFKELAEAGAHISYIGDPKQGIYLFNGANPAYLAEVIAGGHEEHSLKETFRSTRPVVDVINARFGTNIGTNKKAMCEIGGAFTYIGAATDAIEAFKAYLVRANLDVEDAAILARRHKELEDVCKDPKTKGWRNVPKQCLRAWRAERLLEFGAALRAVTSALSSAMDESFKEGMDESLLRSYAWRFLREEVPEPLSSESPREWNERLKKSLSDYMERHELKRSESFGHMCAVNEIPQEPSAYEFMSVAPTVVRTTVVHQVKGETIGAVLLIGSEDMHSTWLAEDDGSLTEEHNICYVAFSRAAELLVLHCPSVRIAEKWHRFGFKPLPVSE